MIAFVSDDPSRSIWTCTVSKDGTKSMICKLLANLGRIEQMEASRETDAAGRPRKVPRPHRCNDRLEDLIESLFEGNLVRNVPGPAKLWWRCMRAKPGEEPTEPYTYIIVKTPKGPRKAIFLSGATQRTCCRKHSCKSVKPPVFNRQPFLSSVFGRALGSIRNAPHSSCEIWLCWSAQKSNFCLFSSLSGPSSTVSDAASLKIDDPKLAKAIAYEANKGFCDSTGSTTRFSDFLDSQLSTYVVKSEPSVDSKGHKVLMGLVQDAKLYNEMSHGQRLKLLDRVAQIQGFSCTKDLVDHQIAVAEASQNLYHDGISVELESLATRKFYPEAQQNPPVVYGSSERIELFKPRKRISTVAKSEAVHVKGTEKTPPALGKSECKSPALQNSLAKEDIQNEHTRAPDSLQAKDQQLSAQEAKVRNKDKASNIEQDDWKLDTPLSDLKCFTSYQKSQLQENGFYTARNLLNHFPRAHISFDSPTDTLEEGQNVSLFGTIIGTRAANLKNSLVLLEVILSCNIGQDCLGSSDVNNENSVILHVKRFFQGPRYANYWFLNKIASSYPEGSKAAVSGKVKAMKIRGHFEVRDYDLKVVEEDFSKLKSEGKAYPVYPAKGLLQPKKIQSCIQRMLIGLPSDIDPLPVELTSKYELLRLNEAYLGLHSPHTMDEANRARGRIVFDDFFYLQLAFLLQRKGIAGNEEAKLLEMERWPPLTSKVVDSLPFKLTAGQIKAASEIMWDLRQPGPMSRLLQGDVGCGKTIVAFLALLDVASSGYQGALMAPTEFVASQHYRHFLSWLEVLEEKDRPKIALLTGSTNTAAARLIREGIANKEIAVVVGTHALIADGTNFSALGLAVIDEQHRFGVIQRDRLKATYFTESELLTDDSQEGKVKLTSTTHILAMSATPIPRSLALTLHGDMTISQITEIPPGRFPTETHVLPDSEMGRQKAYKMIQEELEKGGRAFIVYPLVVESNHNPDQHAAVVDFEKVAAHFKDYKCTLVHGRMKPDMRNEEMRKFREGECQILVSTTVIEVGIDIPEATVILVENAESYGVAQLHQLRGRVGRGKKKSLCILLSSCEASMSRLKLLEGTTDGFCLAEADLRMRGPGDLLGKRQSGRHLEFVLARLGEDGDILEQARAAAIELLQTHKNLDELPKLKQEINIRQLPSSWS